MNAAAMIRSLEDWLNTLAKLSRVSGEKCKAMIKDLTFDFRPSSDLHVYPFVALNASMSQLALPLHFPLQSNAEENIFARLLEIEAATFQLSYIPLAISLYGTPRVDRCSEAAHNLLT